MLDQVRRYGIIPCASINKPTDGPVLCQALAAGGLNLIEVLFRTPQAAEALAEIRKSSPNTLAIAGTIQTTDMANKAIDVGAQCVITPGLNRKVIELCIDKKVPVIPGTSTPSDFEAVMEYGLQMAKLFPANSLGGPDYLKNVSGPYSGLQFVPTGGVNAGNIQTYLSLPNVAAVGGTWLAPSNLVAEGQWATITCLAREAVLLSHGFGLAHVGMNARDEEGAKSAANFISLLFGFPLKEGNSSFFAGSGFEIMKEQGTGKHGHIAIHTINVDRAISYLEGMGFKTVPSTAKKKDGKIIAIYFDQQILGFSFHLLQK